MKLLSVIALFIPAITFANSNCDKPINDFDGLYCLNKVYSEADKELNEKYTDLVPQLDSEGKKLLKKGQISWMKDRNLLCSMKKGSAFFVNLECATRFTVERAEFLQDRIRECKSSGCLNSKL